MITSRDQQHLDEVEQWLADLRRRPERWPIVQTGEREPLSWPLRLSIYRRDVCCLVCYGRADKGYGEIDHIVPWSAGGLDRSNNLRLLCIPCNQAKSNFRLGMGIRVLPTTWHCTNCWTENTAARYWRPDQRITYIEPDEGGLTFCFCAGCDTYGTWTDRPL